MNIAVAVDGSDNALRAAKYAIKLASYFPGARLEVIFVADYDKTKEEHLLTQSPEGITLKRDQKTHPIIDLATAEHIDAHTILLKGKPSLEIINYVNEHKVDHLVLGSRGLNVFQEMILGSVSHKVMKHANCPVTIVK